MSLKDVLYDWKNRLQDRKMLSIIIILFVICIVLGLFIYKKQIQYRQETENRYNMAFFELVEYVENVENYLAKSVISSTSEHGAETLTEVWRESNLAVVYLNQLPIATEELATTSKFLNQVSDYSFALSRKNIYNEKLSQEELDDLKKLHDYSIELKSTLNQLAADMESGRISWGELTKKGSIAFAQEVSNFSKESFSNINKNFETYAGLIYDGAYSEHLNSFEKKGLVGEEISENVAKEKIKEIIDENKIEAINFNGLIENGEIIVYDFYVKIKEETKDNYANISISKKGGHVVIYNYNRDIDVEVISNEDAINKGKEFLNKIGISNMKETYFLKQDGIITVNYAYYQDEVTVYPDLIKVKVALDNGEILGMETKGYLNFHIERKIETPKLTKEEAKKDLNDRLEIFSEGLAIIPTKWNTEVLCYEFKGKINETDFLVYINAITGKEENILIIIDTPNGTLTL